MSQDFSVPTGTATYSEEPSGFPSSNQAAGSSTPDGSTTDVAKDQAANVGQTAAQSGGRVAGVAKDQAANVVSEAADQASDLLARTKSELQEQAAVQQQRVAAGIHSISAELASLAENHDGSDTTAGLVRQASQRADQVASWLDDRDPGSLLQEVSSFARRRPGAFLAIAAGAGVLAGRLTRGAVDAAKNNSPSTTSATSTGTPTPPAATIPVATASSGYQPVYPETVVEPGILPEEQVWS